MITPFEMAVSSVRVGVGVKREDGMDLKELGTKLAMVVTDPIVVKLSPVRTTIESLEQNGIVLGGSPKLEDAGDRVRGSGGPSPPAPRG